jgi:glycosyltransferase involved in cell wall biosynthesis
MYKKDLIPPQNGSSTPPQVAVYLYEPRGGHWKYTKNLLENLDTPCLLVTSNPISHQNHWCLPILNWSAGPHHSLFSKVKLFLTHFQNILKLYQAVKRYQIQLIHFQSFEPISIRILLPLLRKQALILFSVHNVLPHKYYSDLTKNIELRFRNFIYLQAQGLFVFSRYGAGMLKREFGIHADKITYLPMGIHESVPESITKSDSVPDQPEYLMFGGYRSNKGFEILREAFIQAKKEGLPGTLHIAGSYPDDIVEDTKLQFLRSNLGDQILIKNWFISEEEIDGIMRSADVIILPYTSFESQSGVIFLAYAYHLPLITSRVGGLSEVIEEDGSGILVQPGNVADLKGALFEVLERWDEFRVINTSQLLKSKYSWNNVGQKTDQVYHQILTD